MILKIRHNYIIRSYKDFLLFLRDLKDMGYAEKNNYIYKWDNTKFVGKGVSLVVTPGFYIKWGHIKWDIINNMEEIIKDEKRMVSTEFRDYKILYYEQTKILKYNKESICPQ